MNGCVGRAEMSKRYLYHSLTQLQPFLAVVLILSPKSNRQDWACEASFAIYPLYEAILQYTIETLILDANILRDSILVRLEMVLPIPLPLTLTHTKNQTQP